MNVRALFLLVLVVVMVSGCSLNEGNREQMVDLQKVEDNPDKQLENLNEAIARSKRDGSLYTRRAMVLLKKGSYNEALADANEAVKLTKNHPSALFVKAQALRLLGREQEALPLALQAERNSDQNTSLYVLLGELYLKQKDYAQSRVYIRKALELSPTDEFALYYQGRLAEAANDTVRAVRNYRLALDQSPEFMEPKRELAGILVAQKDYVTARSYLTKAQRAAPKDGLLWYYRGLLYLGEQKPDSAHAFFNRAISIADTLQGAHYKLGLRAYIMGENEAAISHLLKAPGYEHLLKYNAVLAGSYERTGQYLKALEQYQRILARDPNYTFAYGSIRRLKSKLQRPAADTTSVQPVIIE
ncbi:tetratricopeptide repeat protein [Pontibacter vulgaris]|uniref:tetratricopeptide repeat protein n=1 Tax=Pontibacter vulgaris TaxID=2905679 RepID=UPI001FA79F55|nr:tetratricopeptide repeat protein [Pontibacter vulgaris]